MIAPRFSGLGLDIGDFPGLEGRDLVDRRAGLVQHRGKQAADFILQRGELANQRGPIHQEARPMDAGQRDDLEEVEGFADEHRQPRDGGRSAGFLIAAWSRFQVRHHLLGLGTSQALGGKRLDDFLDPVLELDEVLAPAPVPGLDLQVTGNDPVLARGRRSRRCSCRRISVRA
jgi:hypothetical protein